MLEDSTKKLQKQMEDLKVSGKIWNTHKITVCEQRYIHLLVFIFIILLLQSSEEASMVELDGYLEGLYDDLQAKTKSTGLILQLAREPENLIELASNGMITQIYRVIYSVTCTYLVNYRLPIAGAESSAKR